MRVVYQHIYYDDTEINHSIDNTIIQKKELNPFRSSQARRNTLQCIVRLFEQFFERMSDLTRNHVEAELYFDLMSRE